MKKESLYSCYVIGSVLVSCAANMFCIELIIREAPKSGNLVTFSQFLFVAVEGFVMTSKFGTVKRIIPLNYYAALVSLFFVVQTLNNYAPAFNISAPLLMIFRSGSLLASLTLNILVKHCSYPWSKHMSVWLVTIGVIFCTFASAPIKASDSNNDSTISTGNPLLTWLIGIALLTLSLFLSAGMGLLQETIYAKYGKHPQEALYYNHLLPLPFFLIMYSDIYNQAVVYNSSVPETFLRMTAPRLWWILAMNSIMQYFCIRSVFIMTAEFKSLTVTLVVTLRKFISLLVSIIYFRNHFTLLHWSGTTLVFVGTLLYANVFSALPKRSVKQKTP